MKVVSERHARGGGEGRFMLSVSVYYTQSTWKGQHCWEMTLSGSKKYFLMRKLNLKVPDYGFTGKMLLFLGEIGKILPNFTKQIARKILPGIDRKF